MFEQGFVFRTRKMPVLTFEKYRYTMILVLIVIHASRIIFRDEYIAVYADVFVVFVSDTQNFKVLGESCDR